MWLLILLHLLDHRNLSLHTAENFGNLIDDLQLKNLHDFLHSGCSTHLRLHFRIVRILTRQTLFPLHNWDVNFSFSELPQFSVPFASLAPASNFGNIFHLIKELNMWRFLLCGRFEPVWTWRYVSNRWLTNMSLCSTFGTRTVGTCLYCTISTLFMTFWTVGTCLCVITGD